MELFAAWLVVIVVELVTPPPIKPASWAMRSLCVDTIGGKWVPDKEKGNKKCDL